MGAVLVAISPPVLVDRCRTIGKYLAFDHDLGANLGGFAELDGQPAYGLGGNRGDGRSPFGGIFLNVVLQKLKGGLAFNTIYSVTALYSQLPGLKVARLCLSLRQVPD